MTVAVKPQNDSNQFFDMEYNISKNELRNDLLAETLHELSICYTELGAEVYVVGAAARDIAMHLLNMLNALRRTLDLDVAELLQTELDQEENSPLLNDMLDMSDSRNYMLFRRALKRMAQILCP